MVTRAQLVRCVLLAAVLGACSVHRQSDGLACTSTTPCSSGRQCVDGYCVVANCPSDCTTCDEAAKTCTMDCTDANTCGNVTCPSGWTCTINCMGGNACDNIDCDSMSTCTITCSGGNACNNIDCHSDTTCMINCATANACNDVDCASSCSCDLACMGAACDVISCPSPGSVECTVDGTAGKPCSSTTNASCHC